MENPQTYSSPPLNYLIYGHPGTGKRTYASQLAVSLADQLPIEEVVSWPAPQLYDRYQALVNEGQLFFLVMHPGWSYADMIERCLFQSDTVIVHDGILKQLATEARGNLIEHLLQQQPGVLPSMDFKDLYSGFLSHLQQNGDHHPTLGTKDPFLLHSIQKNGDILLRKPKTYQVIRIKRSKIRQLFLAQQKTEDPQTFSARWQAILEGENGSAFAAVWAQFAHYQEAFAEPLEPIVPAEVDPYRDIQMEILPPGVLQASKKYVLILEHVHLIEPQILFGDALPILDSRRREGCRCAQSVLLPGSKTSFTLPPNLFLIGTAQQMPTWSEDSAYLMSKAFQFVHLDANSRHQDWPKINSLATVDLWKAINRVIARHKGEAFQFPGGAFQDCKTFDDVSALFGSRILPYIEWLSRTDKQLHEVMLNELLGPKANDLDGLEKWKPADFIAISKVK